MDGSNGKIISLLERIAEGQEQTNARLDGLTEEVKQMRVDLGGRIDQTNARLDNLVDFLGAHHADHEQRIRALEDRVFKKSS